MVASLASSPIGQVTRISGHDPRFREDYEVEAYLPDDLPDAIELPGSTWMALSEAMVELGRLDAAASLIPNPLLSVPVRTQQPRSSFEAMDG
jgi:hypothetical protein